MKSEPRPRKKTVFNWKWIVQVFIVSLILSAAMTIASDAAMANAGFIVAVIAIVILIALNVLSDMLGTAVTSAVVDPFVAMASKKVRGAKQAIGVIQNAEFYANLFNDIIGDICGVVSGAAGAAVAIMLSSSEGFLTMSVSSVIVSSMISALTVMFKAIAKTFAIQNSQGLVLALGYVLSYFKK
ncbi:hypothetical protein LJC55_00630 [Eubacteriales bacterium OttesenSCG-928-N14]|nr:hypothetical protein [Eubacteriales bacterium OttesenSCG-928-N14]